MDGAKGKRKRKPTKPDDPVQSARFIEAAKQLGLGGDTKDFERAFGAIAAKKPKSKK